MIPQEDASVRMQQQNVIRPPTPPHQNPQEHISYQSYHGELWAVVQRRYTKLRYTTLQYTTIHYTNYTTSQIKLQVQLRHTNYTTVQLQLLTTTPLHHNYNYNCTTPRYIQQLWWDDHCKHCNRSKKHSFNHLWVHQWIPSASHD